MNWTEWESYRNSIGERLCHFGERIGSERLTYNPFVYGMFHDMALKNAPRLVPVITDHFPDVKRVVDIGCGTGVYSREFAGAGCDVTSLEYSPVARKKAAEIGVEVHPWELTDAVDQQPRGRPYDLSMSIEVAEHLPEFLADRFVDFIASGAPLVLLTAAQPGQGGHGHINEQPREYWIKKFEARGYEFSTDETESIIGEAETREVDSWLFKNIMVFRSASGEAFDVNTWSSAAA